jgi:Domain of unknown function (DUF4386)
MVISRPRHRGRVLYGNDCQTFCEEAVFRSTFFPRILGLLLAIGGLGYSANIFANVIPPAIGADFFPYVMLPAGIAEISLALWLLVIGVNVQRWKEQSSAAGAIRK